MLTVLTEGNDEFFIQKYLTHLGYKYDIDFETLSIGGWRKIPESKPKIMELIDSGNKVIIVFDADGDYNNGGFDIRSSELDQILKDNMLNLDFFLMPNNKDDGDFEDLLERIATDDRTGIFQCFDDYEKCVENLETNETKFKTPLKKSRIYAYIESFDESNNKKNKESEKKTFFYDDSKYWNLNSDELNKLKDFFLIYLPNQII